LTIYGLISRFGGIQAPDRQAIYMPIIGSEAVAVAATEVTSDIVVGQAANNAESNRQYLPLVSR